jgi:flagellar L-ring protein precursor FlgH
MKKQSLRIALSGLLVCGLVAHAAADSLYKPQTFRALTSDRKAAVVGDLLTIQVFENATATTSADTATRRSASARASLIRSSASPLHASLDAGGDFDGGGSTQRTNRFLTTVTVAVKEVLPNGDLRVEGQQVLSLNDERQTVNIQGRVRPVDIADGNVVLSTRLGDATITLVGDGDLTERQRRSWWKRATDWFGL